MAKSYKVTPSVRRANRFTSWMARRGIGRTSELTTVGCRSGEEKSVPVSPISIDGVDYLVSPYGEVSWVKNVRVNPRVTLRYGGSSRTPTLIEMTGQAASVVKAYYEREGFARPYMDVPESPDLADFEAASAEFPVFRIEDN